MEWVEEFEGGADGVALSTANTAFASFNGTATMWTFSTAAAVFGSRGSRCVPVAANIYGSVLLGANSVNGYLRVFWRLNSLPAGAQLVIINAVGGGVNRAQVTVTSTGHYCLRNVAALVATSANVYTGVPVRLEWDVTGGTQTLRIYSGANLNGTTATETLTGPVSVATGFDTFRIGAVTADSWSQDIDGLAVSTTAQPGPHAVPPSGVADAYVWQGGILVPADTYVWDGTTLVPADVSAIT